METEVLEFLTKRLKTGRKCAMILLEVNEGSTPGVTGSIMAVDGEGGRTGTIGGGNLEFQVVARALEGMKEGKHFGFEYSLVEKGELKMVCGGDVKGFVKYFNPPSNLVIFGAGHVGEKLAEVAKPLGFNIYVADDREEFSELPAYADIKEYISLKPSEAKVRIPFGENTYIVVATRGHILDQEAYRACLGEKYAYLGGLGSRKKALETLSLLKESGFSEDSLKDIHLPIGLDISNGTPGEIAVAILAEILQVKNGKELRSMKDRLSSAGGAVK
jgi:xanthine dehydrogenase accessory factor